MKQIKLKTNTMLTRVKNRKEGAPDYYRNGTAEKPREEFDKRIPLGDLELFEERQKWIRKNKKWSTNYKNFTFSLSGNDEKKIKQMSEDEQIEFVKKAIHLTLEKMFPHRTPDELDVYSEIHDPIIKIHEDKERFYHWHCSVSLLDPRTGNRLSAVAMTRKFNASVQSFVAAELGLDDPIDFIDWNNPKNDVKLSKRGELVRDLSDYIAENKPSNYQELCELISAYDKANLTIKRSGSSKSPYLSVVTTINGKEIKPIRLKGGNFPNLAAIYNEKFNVKLSDYNITNHRRLLEKIRSDSKFRDQIIEQETKRFLDEKGRREFTDSAIEWRKKMGKFDFPELTQAQKNWWRIYGCNVQSKTIGNTKLFKDRTTENVSVWMPDHRVRLIDSGNQITTNGLTTDAKMQAAIHMMIKMGDSKGWLNEGSKMEFTGSPEFIAKAEAELAKYMALKKKGQTMAMPDAKGIKEVIELPNNKPSEDKKPIDTPAEYISKEKINWLKYGVNTTLMRQFLVQKNQTPMSITKNKKGHDIWFIGGKKYNSIDALVKCCGFSVNDAMRQVEEFKRQKGGEPNFNPNPQPTKMPAPTRPTI